MWGLNGCRSPVCQVSGVGLGKRVGWKEILGLFGGFKGFRSVEVE